MSRSAFYLWCILLVVCSSRTHIGYGARIDPQRSSNVSENLDPVKVAQEKCQEYSQIKHDMKRPSGTKIPPSSSIRIQYAQEDEFPHMALIGTEMDDEEKSVEWICGGSLISPQYVLTAAHYFDPTSTATKPNLVILGLTNKPDGDVRATQYRDNVYRIVERINHPEYRLPKIDNDIALLKLDRPAVLLNSTIRPLCLALSPNANYNVSQAIATGWGQTEVGGTPSERLKKVSLSLLDDSKCIKAFGNETALSKGFDAKSMICAGAERPTDGDTCVGDGGGPLQFPIDFPEYTGMWLQEGIISYGSSYCDEPSPGIYTRVSYFLPWIQSIVWPV